MKKKGPFYDLEFELVGPFPDYSDANLEEFRTSYLAGNGKSYSYIHIDKAFNYKIINDREWDDPFCYITTKFKPINVKVLECWIPIQEEYHIKRYMKYVKQQLMLEDMLKSKENYRWQKKE